MGRLRALFRIPRTLRMTHREYRANVEGMNIVFGAVLGFVLAGAETSATYDFAILLLLSATMVATILYLGNSPYPLFYGVIAILAVAMLPAIIEDLTDLSIPKLQPTLAVWTTMVILLELLPREGREPSLSE